MVGVSKGWPKTAAFGHFNAMALCTGCDKDATQTRITYYVLDALNGGPYRCDECRTKQTLEQTCN
jgi:hypothetical protein